MYNRIAIIDLGTNTFHLLIVEVGEKTPILIHQSTIAASLGEGGMKDGKICASAFERGLSALKQFRQEIEWPRVEKIKAMATSALRSASNGPEFINQAFAETGIQIKLIDGNREAGFIYSGVRAAIKLGTENSLIMDIGGGSVEFIICNQEQIFWKKSFDIGAARLMNQFHHSDPISKSDMDELHTYLNSVLAELKSQIKIFKPLRLIGSAGAFETYAALINKEFKSDFQNPEHQISLNEFENIAQYIIESTEEERAKNPAIPKIRVNMIVVACLLTRQVLSLHSFQELKLSTYSMKEGILFEMINN